MLILKNQEKATSSANPSPTKLLQGGLQTATPHMISILPYDLVKTSVAFLEIPPCAPAAMSQSMALYFCPEIRMPQILGNPQNGLLIREHPIKMDDEDVALFQEAPILQHLCM